MRLLALDSSTLTLSAALVELGDDGAVIRVREAGGQTARGQHSVRLPGVLTELLEAEGLAVGDLDGLVAGLGPGSFTGLRTGLATLKGLAYAARRPLTGASSLSAMALAAADALAAAGTPAGPDTLLVPTLDARREQVYAGFYRVDRSGAVVADGDDQPLDPAALVEAVARASGAAVVFGQGAVAYPDALGPVPKGLPLTPPAAALARLGARSLGSFDKAAVLALVPRYVRRSEAEEKRAAGLLRLPGSR